MPNDLMKKLLHYIESGQARTSLIMALILLSGCTDQAGTQRVIERNQPYCTAETAEKRASFILQCIGNANPKSDEEPEDWITLCQKMAEETICDIRTIDITEECTFSSLGNCGTWREVSREVK